MVKKINQVDDEKLKQSLLNILINLDINQSDNSIVTNSELELELEQIEYESYSEVSQEESEEDYCLRSDLCTYTNCKSINMLTKDQTTVLISIIEKLEESPLKNEFLSQLNNLIK